MHNLQEHCFKYDGWHEIRDGMYVFAPDGMVLTEQENEELSKWVEKRSDWRRYSHPMYFLLRAFAYNGTYLHFLTSNKDTSIFLPEDEAPTA